MRAIASWWARRGLQARLQILIQGMLVAILLAAQYWVTQRLERQVMAATEERAIAVADGAINGLNTLMVTKLGDDDVISDKKSREEFLRRMGASDGIREMRVIRSPQLDTEFEPGLPQEYARDDMDRAVLESGKPRYDLLRGENGDASLRAVLPFVARKNFRGIDCMRCHAVPEGFVLGAASVTIDVRPDLESIARINGLLWGGQLALQIFLFAAIGWIVKRILRQIGGEPAYATEISRRVAEGDLAFDIDLRPGDGSSLMAHMRDMKDHLHRLVGHVSANARQLGDSVSSVVENARQVAATSEEQNQATVSMASTIDQITASIENVANHANHALEMATDAGRHSDTGAATVREAIGEMAKISQSVELSASVIRQLDEKSAEISSIVKVIKDIADQTNLLALNAAIEAARAGEQGRGFAVVADEVRKLAERTAASTQEIATMIGAIQDSTRRSAQYMNQCSEQVQDGMRMAERSGESMGRIDASTEKVQLAVESISSSLLEQTRAANLLAQEVERIAQESERNSLLAAQASSSVTALDLQAKALTQAVQRFRVRVTGPGAVPAPCLPEPIAS
ncbi:MAG TPA: methyl-accepting chemotaxis protein [Rhodocyclaceae bacterium]